MSSEIRTPDQRLRVFVSSTLQEVAPERVAAKEAITHLHLIPVMFELGARPHPPRELYRAYLQQSQVFIGIYWERYGWVAPGEEISGLEDEYRLSEGMPRLLYMKEPAPNREPRLQEMIGRVQHDDQASYRPFSSPEELRDLIENDLAILLTEHFQGRTAAAAETENAESRLPELPVARDRLVGRDEELRAATELLQRDDVGVVTFTGPGGTGKTRLALEVARRLVPSFPDGVAFIPLAPVTEAALVPSTIASTLGLREASGQSVMDALRADLRDKRLLLVLDNFEQVIDAAPAIGELLGAAAGLKALVTSRIALRLREEREYHVPPLDVPDPAEGASLEKAARSNAVELFVEQAQRVKPDFSLTSDNAAVLVEICRRLDGLPLAIELAAARVRVLAPRAMLERLERSLPMLTGGARDLPSRQQTMRAAIAWSYDLLNEGEARLFRQLSVFSGGLTLEAAAQICGFGADAELDLLDGLTSLVEKSLVQQREVDGDARFSMLSTIREYGLERLRESGELTAMAGAHARYFRDLAEQGETQFMRGELAWLRRIQIEHDNARAAVVWALGDDGNTQLGGDLVASLGWFWFVAGYLSEGLRWAEAARAKGRESFDSDTWGGVLLTAGSLALAAGNPVAAGPLMEESLSILRGSGDRMCLASALVWSALTAITFGQPDRALQLSREGAQLYTSESGRWGEATARSVVADALTMTGDWKGARELSEEALTAFRSLGDAWGIARSTMLLAGIAWMEGDGEKACSLYGDSVGLFRVTGDKWHLARALAGLGVASIGLGAFDRAEQALRESLGLWQELTNESGTLLALAGLARMALGQGQTERARLLFAPIAARPTEAGLALDAIAHIQFSRLKQEVAQGIGLEAEPRPLGPTLEEAARMALASDQESERLPTPA